MDWDASTKAPTSSLPQEIVDAIIDTFALPVVVPLARDDPLYETRFANLKALSLVCHAFTPRSQTHIFSVLAFALKVSYGNKEADAERRVGLLNLLKTKSHITQNVHGISLDLMPQIGITPMWNVDYLNLFAEIQSLCSNITSLHVQGFSSGEDGNEFGHNPLFRPGPLTTFKTITCIRFKNVTIGVSALVLYPRLSDLCMSSAIFVNDTSTTGAANIVHAPRTILHTLQFDWTNDVSINDLADLVEGTGPGHPPILDLGQLRSFRHAQHALTDQMAHLLTLGRILRCCPALEKLNLRGSWLPILLRKLDEDSTIFRLSQLPKLSELAVEAMVIEVYKDSWEVRDRNPFTESPFLDIIYFLNTMSAENNLSRLELELAFMSSPQEISIVNISATVNWKQLAAQVIRIANGKALEVELVIEWIIARMHDAGSHDAHGRDAALSEEKHQVGRILRSTFDEDLHAEMQSLRCCPWVKMNIVYNIC